jgi:hypothetical protein
MLKVSYTSSVVVAGSRVILSQILCGTEGHELTASYRHAVGASMGVR